MPRESHGFFNANGAHPYENPTPLANFIEMLAIAVLPAALVNTFGRMTNRPREARAIFAAMVFLFVAGLLACDWAERSGNAMVTRQVEQATGSTLDNAGGNMEGKETRFGIAGSVLAGITTSNGATGSYNSMDDSYMPLGGGVLLVNMLLGEIAFGGLGTGLFSMILIALTALFLAGLMIGRTPEFLGKEIGIPEMKLIMLFTLASPITVLLLTAVAVTTEPGLAGLTTNNGAHGIAYKPSSPSPG